MSAIVAIIVLLVLIGVIALAWKARQRLRGIIEGRADPGFTIVSVSRGQHSPYIKNATKKAAADDFEILGITESLGALCKLTGEPRAICCCEWHIRKKWT